MFAGGAALACLLFGGGCSGGRVDGSGYEPLLPLTLSWDQPDMRADYYQVKAGPVMVRAEQPIVRLQLPSGSYRVEIESCNAAGCSPPTTVEVEYREGRWLLVGNEASGAEFRPDDATLENHHRSSDSLPR